MAWEKRENGKRYYYRSVRDGRKVRRVYCGTGLVGQLMSDIDDHCRAQRVAHNRTRQEQEARIEAVVALGQQLQAECVLLGEAVLLSFGFHRPNRVPWRRWNAAHKIA